MDADAARGRELDALRPALLRIARLHLRNDAWAEDCVSETLLAALESRTEFEARSKLKTWVVGILKHKIVDSFRAHRREEPLARSGTTTSRTTSSRPTATTATGRSTGRRPESQLSRDQFLETLELCVQQLPQAQGRIFLMREWLELPTPDICKELAITATNAGVLLHRARLRLRECLRLRWFEGARP